MRNFTRVPNEIIDNGEIDAISKMIIIYVHSRQNLEGWVFRYTAICKTLKISISTLKRHMKWLVEHNFVEHFQENNKWILRLKSNK